MESWRLWLGGCWLVIVFLSFFLDWSRPKKANACPSSLHSSLACLSVSPLITHQAGFFITQGAFRLVVFAISIGNSEWWKQNLSFLLHTHAIWPLGFIWPVEPPQKCPSMGFGMLLDNILHWLQVLERTGGHRTKSGTKSGMRSDLLLLWTLCSK